MKFPSLIKDNQSSQKNQACLEKSSTQPNNTFRGKTQDMEGITFPHYKAVSDYLLGTCIGEGAFAKVRIGLHCPTKEKVAIKIINKLKAKKDSYVFKNLHREGKIMQMLRHPNVVQVYDILETGNNYYLITELCSGGELIDIVGEKGFLSEDIVRKYVAQLVNAVAYMHKRKIVHRDLKVENLLLDSEGNLKIIDFGLSNVVPDSCSNISCVLQTQCGSPGYAAPELLARKAYGPKVDVWSIGVITYALLVGKLPYTVSPLHIPKLCKKMMKGEMNPIPPNISSYCKEFIKKLLSPNYEHRPTIHDVMKMKWISAFQNKTQQSSNRSSPFLLKDQTFGEASLRQSSITLAQNSSSSIDSDIVKKMVSLYGFFCSDVVHCVHKNRPGSALVTYQLLKKQEKRNSQQTKDLNFVQATRRRVNPQKNISEVEQPPSNPLTDQPMSQSSSSDDGSHSVEFCDGFTTPLSYFPKIETSERSAKASSSSPYQEEQELQYNNDTQNGASFQNKTVLASNKEALEKEQLVDNLNPSVDCQHFTPPCSLSLDNSILKGNVFSKGKKGKTTKRNQTSETVASCSCTAKDNSATNKSKLSEVNKLLATTSMTQRDQAELFKPNKQVEPDIAHQHIIETAFHKNKARELLPSIDTTTSSFLQTCPCTLSPKIVPLSLPRSLSQQKRKGKEDVFSKHSCYPSNSQRGFSNFALPEIPNNVSPSHTSTSPFKERSNHYANNTKEKLIQTEKLKSGVYAVGRKFVAFPQLPMIITKPSKNSQAQGQQWELQCSPSITTGSYQISQSLSITPSQFNKTVSVKNDRKHLDTKVSVSLRLKKRQNLKSNQALIDLERNLRFNLNSSKHTTREMNKPRKVISEPIAAAISHLTSTKNKSFIEEKDVLFPTN